MLLYQNMNQRQRQLYDEVKNANGVLFLDGKQIDDEQTKAIAEALKVHTKLTDLSLDGNQIGDAGAQAIAEALKVNKTLASLSLGVNQIGDVGAQAIAEVLTANKTLKELGLDQNFISENGINVLKQIGDKTFFLSADDQSKPSSAQLQEMASRAAQTRPSVLLYQIINQRQRELYDEVMNASGTLHLFEYEIGDEEAKAIAEALKVNTKLSWLNLAENQIGDVGAQAIAEGLTVNTTLTELFLNRNQIGDVGAQAIAEALKVNTKLTLLSLDYNQIGDAGAQAIAEALKVNKTLTEFYLDDNQIGDAGAQAIAEALKVNKKLTKLDLDQNFISDNGIKALRQVGNRTCQLNILNQSTPSPAQLQEMTSRAAQVRPSVPTTEVPQITRSAAAGVPHAAPSSSHAPSSSTPPVFASKPRGSANAGPAKPTDSTEEIRQLQARIAQLELAQQAPTTSAAPILSTIPRVSLQVLSQATTQFSESKRIGGGGFGSVYSGVWSGQRVAVKRLAADSTQGVAQFEAELEALSRFRHPNIVTIMCYAQEGNERCLFYELMPNGSVRDRLDRKGGALALSWQQRQSIATGVANAMHFVQTAISRQPLFHLDLKTDNVLLDAHFNAKVADFGLTRSAPAQVDAHSSIRTQTVQGTLQYICPQYRDEGKVSIKTDVYSYGMILLELVTGQQPSIDLLANVRRELKRSRKIDAVLDKAIDWSPQDKESAQAIAELAVDCLEQARVDRPSFGEILRRLSGEEAEVNEEEAVAGSERECLRQDKCMICRVLPTTFETGKYNQTFVP
ncbi:hypothetical protein CAOG_03786 [Capsaspora owczarzaki ATCC 30864]|uniref:hypothetical protein n=1 Tax=Capsaspora owczarzaki (strain ATCC 30864) TaxID=595528 RepID=UPI0001FE266C|nr:hypothetical protein CAOG_03786 [Capsaspora owczarzaki ATCC 30864]|eukprot:XP_004363514.1 hypothetical protein CAOG_03786 [Capsaspora owczarzaki ATCC 30864]